ncbi:TerB family tellurite resistance protein [Paraglaciecola aquimarina]|uniref:TerB family tellurite resistance protein n=1 Tax=Paraglaciecola aquimarina TaxID=1235557 RepID=A0ABU3SXZ3_9ALTE|nr:TerB family tellurite resistance protein [Paraglaciecola aquimarina]MDU0354792.1 TerB family tellurite resistance protein [Paraglaciecola aquimarina]
MIASIQNWFKEQLKIEEHHPGHTLELATAVLFYEVMRADNKFENSEQVMFRQRLEKHFSLSPEQLDILCSNTQEYAENAVDYQQFTRVLNHTYNGQQKVQILDSLWTIAFSDKVLSPSEEYTIRKIADLLYIPHTQFIQSKLSNNLE